MAETTIAGSIRSDVEALWNYHDMQHELHPCDVGIGLGSHDLGVAVVAVESYRRGMFPRIIFTGANVPTTIDRFPRGEAAHYQEYAIDNGVPPESVLIETRATNTAENISLHERFSRQRHLAAVGAAHVEAVSAATRIRDLP